MRRAALVLIVAAAGCRGGHPVVPAGTPIVIVSIDTLRSDHLPAYGYRGVETPAIDALARDAMRFERAYTHVPLTLPAHVSLLSGQLPGVHGVRDNMGYTVDPAKTPMLQRTLRAKGYATGAFVSAYVLRGTTGLGDGFDVYEDRIEIGREIGLGEMQRSGADTTHLALEWLRSVHDKPFFLLLHLYDPHTPYEPPEPFRSRYRSPYDGEIAAADAAVGEFLEELRKLELYDRAVVVLLSDHEEGLGEHGEQEHGIFLYRSTLQVPLLLKLPRQDRAGTSVAEPVQLADVAPTVLGLLGIEPPDGIAGRSLLDSKGRDERPLHAETQYPRLHFGWSDLASVIVGHDHWIEAPAPELYDLATDPGETRNLAAAADPRRIAGLREEAVAHRVPLEAPAAVDEKTRQALAALGYLGGSATIVEGDLPDPKSQRATLDAVREAFRLFAARDHVAAEPALERVLAANPRMLDAWDALGRTREAEHNLGGALAAYQEALRISGGSPVLALSAANLLLRLGRFAEAEAHARVALEGGLGGAREVLALAALRQKKLDEAERWAREAVEARGTRIAPLIVHAEVLLARRRDAEALTLTDRAVEEFNRRGRHDPAVLRGAALVRGRVFAGRGEAERAVAAFEQEIHLFPDQLAAYAHLAALYAAAEDPLSARRVLERMLVANPDGGGYAEAIRMLRLLGDPASAARLSGEARRKFPGDPRLAAPASGVPG